MNGDEIPVDVNISQDSIDDIKRREQKLRGQIGCGTAAFPICQQCLMLGNIELRDSQRTLASYIHLDDIIPEILLLHLIIDITAPPEEVRVFFCLMKAHTRSERIGEEEQAERERVRGRSNDSVVISLEFTAHSFDGLRDTMRVRCAT